MTIGSSSVKAPSRRSADLFQTRNPAAARPGLGSGRRPPPRAAAPWPADASGPQSAPSRPPQGSQPSSGRWIARRPSPAEPPRRSSSPQPARSARSEPSARPDHRGPTHGSDPASRTDLTALPGILTRDTHARSGAGVAERRLRSPRVQRRKGSANLTRQSHKSAESYCADLRRILSCHKNEVSDLHRHGDFGPGGDMMDLPVPKRPACTACGGCLRGACRW